MKDTWDKNIDGDNCPFDRPLAKDSDNLFFIKQLAVSSLYLDKNQIYRGHCVLVYNPKHIVRIDQLSNAEWHVMASDIQLAEIGIYNAMQPDHINVESLGNVVAHLHWHITPRYKTDCRWGSAIWTTTPEEMLIKRLATEEYTRLADKISKAIDEAAKTRD